MRPHSCWGAPDTVGQLLDALQLVSQMTLSSPRTTFAPPLHHNSSRPTQRQQSYRCASPLSLQSNMARPRAKPDSRRNRRQPPVSKSSQTQGGTLYTEHSQKNDLMVLLESSRSGLAKVHVYKRWSVSVARLESQEHSRPLPSPSMTHNRINL
jgi:hypothetical protein